MGSITRFLSCFSPTDPLGIRSDAYAAPPSEGGQMSGQQGDINPIDTSPDPIDEGVRIGHVHLRTADIDRVRAFYVDVLGFDVVAEERGIPGWGTTGDVLFISTGGYHHHLGFNTWKSADGGPQPDGVTGLHHVALAYPT